MTRELLEKLYSRLKSEPQNHRKNKTGCFDFFEEKVLTKEIFHRYKHISVSAKTMKNYYEKHVEGRNNKSKEPSTELKDCIAEYLGYLNYLHFCNSITKNSQTTKKWSLGSFKKKTHPLNNVIFHSVDGLLSVAR
ncbi:hypothetical protein SAMN04489761_0780 [Tenacibaculum sp. MAR_2009_124]|uniref:hypothetical protein n=1 Tax=Tenacibaculum sp. MAR_2009_124 TaxID=1250059 RepID=UPI0008958241|nr:hypothetical protein [Tenacibaculum sp. MAR_2009_124]SEB44854.1 hypothetical protein SAMN04489761_0780 [Tenacibaculum sp. MAR_2009_124]